jgi:hypothetical protein
VSKKEVDLDKLKGMLDMVASQTVKHDKWLREHERAMADIWKTMAANQKAEDKRSARLDRKLEALTDAHIRAEKRLTGLERKRK